MVRAALGWEMRGHVSTLALPRSSPWGPASFEPGSPHETCRGIICHEPVKSAQTEETRIRLSSAPHPQFSFL